MTDELVTEVLASGLDDWVDLAEVGQAVATNGGSRDPAAVKRETLAVVRRLLEQGLARVGDVTQERGGFTAWELPVDDALARIDREWSALGRDELWPGDVCWLDNTEAGDAAARAAQQERG